MIKRTRNYSVVKGVQRGENGELENIEVIVDGACRSAGRAMKKAKRLNKNMLPVSAEYHAQLTTLDDEEYYKICKFGEDAIINYRGTNDIDTVVEDDILSEE
jgi:hypothetical protein